MTARKKLLVQCSVLPGCSPLWNTSSGDHSLNLILKQFHANFPSLTVKTFFPFIQNQNTQQHKETEQNLRKLFLHWKPSLSCCPSLAENTATVVCLKKQHFPGIWILIYCNPLPIKTLKVLAIPKFLSPPLSSQLTEPTPYLLSALGYLLGIANWVCPKPNSGSTAGLPLPNSSVSTKGSIVLLVPQGKGLAASLDCVLPLTFHFQPIS